jgi:predicted aminopeptidase
MVTQLYAVERLRRYPSERTRHTLSEALDRADNFYRVRSQAAFVLADVFNADQLTLDVCEFRFIVSGCEGTKSPPRYGRISAHASGRQLSCNQCRSRTHLSRSIGDWQA